MVHLNRVAVLATWATASLSTGTAAYPAAPQDYSGQTPLSVLFPSLSTPTTSSSPKVVGIGLDLSLTYGTASLALEDGTYQDVAFVHGDQSYRDLFERLVQQSTSKSPATEEQEMTETCFSRAKSKVENVRQRLRTSFGLPPTSDMANLSNMITTLRKKVEAHVGHRIVEAVPTWPRLANISHADLAEAMRYSGLNMPSSTGHQGFLDETSAAYARYRLGFCTSREPNITCSRQPRNVLTLYYSDTYLHTMHEKLGEGHARSTNADGELGDWLVGSGMGLHSRSTYAGGDEAYWNLLREWMHLYVRFWAKKEPLTDIILLGEAADNTNFTAIVESARAQLPPTQMPFLNEESPLFDPARGAADVHAATTEASPPFDDDDSNAAYR
ncbi:Hypothetical protein D9617_32g092080 [Elsinoe fawcettii]|nr:Hypothetical protein D9617_32g092080 [Elsinoe fawcettii]